MRSINNRVLTRIISDNLIWFLLLIMLIICTISLPGFRSYNIFINILDKSVLLGVLVIGQALCMMSGKLDLTAESTMILSTVVAAKLIAPYAIGMGSGLGLNFVIGIIALLAVGALVGAINSFFVVVMKLDAMIYTLSMMLGFGGIALLISEGENFFVMPKGFTFLGSQRIAGLVPVGVVVLLVCYTIFHIFVSKTAYGKKLKATGANPVAARVAGVKTGKIITTAYILSGMLSSLAGLLIAGKLNSVLINMTSGYSMEAVAATILGGVSLFGGKGSILNSLGGVLLLSTISTSLNLVDVSPYWIDSLRGAMIIIAVLIDATKYKIFEGK